MPWKIILSYKYKLFVQGISGMEGETCALIIFTMVLVQTGTGISDDSKQSNYSCSKQTKS